MKKTILKDVFVYADESGHSGKNIFEETSPIYYQGAIISVNDIEDIVKPIIDNYCDKFNVERLHGYELGEERVSLVCNELLSALSQFDWSFHCSVIEKTFISPTKFVDTFFDSFDNKGVSPIWYETQLFRHILSLTIDELLEEELAKEFWQCYLKNDAESSIVICEKILKKVDTIYDKRSREIISDGLNYIISNKEVFSQFIGKNKSAYKEQTPNIIAFSSLLMHVHNFCYERDTQVKEFIHDNSDEFRGTMRAYHRKFSGKKIESDFIGRIPIISGSEHKLGDFKLESSVRNYSLQAVDLFLWLFQRESNKLDEVKELIATKSNEFIISRVMSHMIVDMEIYKLKKLKITDEEMVQSKKLLKKIEEKRREENKE